MKLRIALIAVVQLGLLYVNASSANTAATGTFSHNTNAQISEIELTKRFNAVLDKELSGENVCVTTSAARQLNVLMIASAQKIISEKAFNRVAEAEENIKKFAKVLLTNGTQSGHTRITSDTVEQIISRSTEPPTNEGGGNQVRDLFCPLFPLC